MDAMQQQHITDADAKVREMMASVDGNYIYDAINAMSLEKITELHELTKATKMSENTMHKFAPLVIPELATIKKHQEEVNKVASLMEELFAYQFTMGTYSEDTGKFDYSFFFNAVEGRFTELKLEKKFREKHGMTD